VLNKSFFISFGFEMEEPVIISGGNKNDESSAADEWSEKMQLFHQQILSVLGMVDRKKVTQNKMPISPQME
jgi:hypothetical protein